MYIDDNVVTETVTLRGTDTQMHSRVGWWTERRTLAARTSEARFVSVGLTGLGVPQHSPHETVRSERHVNAGFIVREREWVIERRQNKGGDSVKRSAALRSLLVFSQSNARDSV